MAESRGDGKEQVERIQRAMLKLDSDGRGVALTTLAKHLGMSRHHLRYYLFGFKTKDGTRGGQLKDVIEIKGKEGTNLIIATNGKIFHD